MDQQGLTRKDLLPIFGTTARISEILSGKRSLTLEMVQQLHYRLGFHSSRWWCRNAGEPGGRLLDASSKGKRDEQHRAA
jgi:hypothetical protein